MHVLSVQTQQRARFVLVSLLAAALAGCGDDDSTGPGEFPDVRGTWVGQYSVTSCVLTDAVDLFFCEEVFYPGASLVLQLELDQSRSEVSGIATQGATISGEIEGTVNMAGVVELSGTLGVEEAATTTITAFEVQLEGDSLIGSWSFEVEHNTDPAFGIATVDAELLLVGPSVLAYFNCPVEARLTKNDEVNGLLQAPDCELDDGSYFDVFALNVVPGDEISIEMFSEEFDPFLMIADVREIVLAADGDFGRDTAGVTGWAGQRETWLIIANALAPGEGGAYVLTTERLSSGSSVPGFEPLGPVVSLRAEDTVGAEPNEDSSPSSQRESLRLLFTRPPGWTGSVK